MTAKTKLMTEGAGLCSVAFGSNCARAIAFILCSLKLVLIANSNHVVDIYSLRNADNAIRLT